MPTPTIVFQVNLTIAQEEVFGPMTNQTTVAMLHPDRYSTDQNAAVASIANRANQRIAWLPDMLKDNKYALNGTQFTVSGPDALYLRNQYGIGYAAPEEAILTIISQTN